MARVAVIGERARVGGFALVGAVVMPADDAGEIDDAWRALPPDVAVAVLTPKVARRLEELAGPGPPPRPGLLTVVMPS